MKYCAIDIVKRESYTRLCLVVIDVTGTRLYSQMDLTTRHEDISGWFLLHYPDKIVPVFRSLVTAEAVYALVGDRKDDIFHPHILTRERPPNAFAVADEYVRTLEDQEYVRNTHNLRIDK